MDTNQFKRNKMDSSSSDSDQNSDQIMGDDEPTTIKIVRVQPIVKPQTIQLKPVVIIYNTDQNNSVNQSNCVRSQSGKSSKMSSQSKPSIYEQVQRQDVSYNYTQKRYQRDHHPYYEQNRPTDQYFHSEKYQHHDYRGSNQSQSNNQSRYQVRRENNGYNHRDNYRHPQEWRDNGRQNNNRDYERRNHPRDYRENQSHYERQNHQQRQRNNEEIQYYRREDERNNQRYQQNQYQKKESYKPHVTPSSVQDQRSTYNKREKEKETEHNQKQKQSKKTQSSSPSSQRVSKKQEQVIEKPKQKKEPKMQKQNQKAELLIKNNKELKKNQNQRQSQEKQKQQQSKIPKISQPKQQLKPKIHPPIIHDNPKADSSSNSNINNKSIQTSSKMSQMNKAQSKIIIENSVQQDKSNKNTNLEQSVWDASSDQQQQGAQVNNKSSFECHQISIEYPLPPPIPGYCESYSNIQEDLSLIEALESHRKQSPQSHRGSIPCIPKLVIRQSQQNDNSISFQNKESVLFDQKEIQTISSMFEKIPIESRSVFVQVKVRTSNVSLYRVKSLSSQIFHLKSTKTQEIKNNGFIVIKQSQKIVPRDSQPFSQNIARSNNSPIELKRSKLILAQIKNPIILLQHAKLYQLQQEKHLLQKISSNKSKLKDVSSLISIDEITLRCSNCHSKKSFYWNNEIIPHQCKIECANLLRFEIQAMYTC